jgi:hypothetical protein
VKKTIVILTVCCAFIATLAHHYARPVMAQVRAALIQNIDEPGRSPFTLQIVCPSIGTNFCEGTSTTAVPANKRFVVKNMNGSVLFLGSASVASAAVDINGTNYYLQPQYVGVSFSEYSYTINMPVEAYLEAGQTASVYFAGSNTTYPPSGNLTLTGYLIDLTQ